MHSAPIDIDLQLCYPSARARIIDAAHVKALAASIMESGLFTPITVRRVEKSRSGQMSDAYEVVMGMHRVKAFRTLGRDKIPAVIIDVDDLKAELMLIDENLCRNEFSPAQRANAVARRKHLYEMLHPDTVHGAIGVGREKSRQNGDSKNECDNNRFSKATAEATGKSERSVQRDARRGEILGQDALNKVSGTCLDRGDELDALSELSSQERDELIERAAAGETVTAKRKKRTAPTPFDAQLKTLKDAWQKADIKVRTAFVAEFEAQLVSLQNNCAA